MKRGIVQDPEVRRVLREVERRLAVLAPAFQTPDLRRAYATIRSLLAVALRGRKP